MKNRKLILSLIPEMYLILSVIAYWVLTTSLFNPIAIILLVILITQIITDNKTSGLGISILFIALNLYMSLALMSEYYEYPSGNDYAERMLLFGKAYLSLNIIMSIIMFVKWIKKDSNTISVGQD